MTPRQASVSAAIALLLVIGTGGHASAQAWVADKGALDLGLDYNLGISDKVLVDKGTDFTNGGTTTHQVTVSAEYVPVPKLAVNLALPLAAFKYTGDKTLYPHPGGGRYDDGNLHATLTDLRVGTRYQVLDEPFALSPHIAVSIPVADYETVGNTVAGRHLKMLHVGLGAGYLIGAATYVHLVYEFSLVEKYDRTAETAQHSQNRSDLAFTLGYKLLAYGFDFHLDANVHRTHGGVNFSEFAMLSPNEQLYHDAILDEDMVLVGGGAGYQISDQLSVSLSARAFLTGQNTQNASVLALGVAWSPL